MFLKKTLQHNRFGENRRHDHKARFLGINDPLNALMFRYETGAGYGAAAIGHQEQKKANQKSLDATIGAAQIAAQAQKDAQDAALKASKEGTEASIKAAQDAAAKANELIANANLLVEKYTQEGIDFSNTEAAKAVASIKGIFKDTYDQNIAGFRQNYENIKQEYAAGYGSVEKTLAPWIETGTKANARLQDLSGLNGPEAGKNALQVDPGYQFRLEQGQQAVERGAAGLGNLRSGNTGIALQEYGQGAAADEFTNAFNRLMSLSRQGQAGSSELAGYKWGQTGANAQNTSNLNSNETGARSVYGQQQAGLVNYETQNRIANNQILQNTRNQNALNAAQTGAQGVWNVSNATAGGAQQNANIGIQGAYNTGNALANQAYQIGGAQSGFAQANAQNTINTVNNAANYTDTMSVNAYNRGANAAGTVASIYGGGGGGGQQQMRQYQPEQNNSLYQRSYYG